MSKTHNDRILSLDKFRNRSLFILGVNRKGTDTKIKTLFLKLYDRVWLK